VAPDTLFFRDLSYVLIAAVLGGLVARAARQPLVIGFVFGGMLIGPFTPGPSVSDFHTFELFADIGVILLMFSIGIEFSIKDLLREKWVVLLGAPLSMLLTVAMGLGAGSLLGWPPLQGAVIGIVISVASTMVLVQLLIDRGELHSTHGRLMVGLALVEDLVVVVMPSASAPPPSPRPWDSRSHSARSWAAFSSAARTTRTRRWRACYRCATSSWRSSS
jgi:monovalent cation:H+ antiporter-2, CPA2 family